MNYLHYHLWGNFSMDTLIRDNPKKAIIFAAEEREISPGLNQHQDFSKLSLIDLDIVYGSFRTDKMIDVPKNARLHHWPTLWCSRTYLEFSKLPEYTITHNHITKTYVCLNNKAHNHRCMLIDELVHNDLIKHGAVSWHEPEVSYDWKYWTPTHLVLDGVYPKNLNSYKSLPKEFDSTLFSLVAESTEDVLFITEKTWTPILFKRPVLVFGAKDINKHLESLGIELYHELFDYSFDSLDRIEDRLDGIMSNIKRISQLDLQELRNNIEEKTERNKLRMLEIATSKKYIPPIVYNHIQNLLTNPNLSHTNDFTFLEIYRLLADK